MSVGPLRANAVSSGAPYVQDVVVTGINRDDIGLLVFPRVDDAVRWRAAADASVTDVRARPCARCSSNGSSS